MTDEIWEWEDVNRMMTEDVEERKKRERKKRERKHLMLLAGFCLLALSTVGLSTCGPGDSFIEGNAAGASEDQTFEQWYGQPENRDWYHFNQWYSSSPRNASYYHVRDEFGNGPTGDKAVQIAICESDLNPRAVSKTDDHGIMQLNRPSWERKFRSVTGVSWSEGVYHASYNAKFAKWLYDTTGGFSHWACA